MLMKRNIFFALLIGLAFVSIIIMSGCNGGLPKPDLIPVNPEGWAVFCDLDDSGNLKVHIKNQGNAPAGSSYVEVDFGKYGQSIKPVPALLVDEIVTVLFSIPFGCYDSDCGFEIFVDLTDEIDESNEANNSQIGNCIG